jgi:hypothetical protein
MAQNQRISKNNTTVVHTLDGFRVTLHSTDIVTKNGSSVTLLTGGYNTFTTRARMNQVAHELCDSRFGVFQEKGQLFVRFDQRKADGSLERIIRSFDNSISFNL